MMKRNGIDVDLIRTFGISQYCKKPRSNIKVFIVTYTVLGFLTIIMIA